MAELKEPQEAPLEGSETEELIRYWNSVINHRWLILTLTGFALAFSLLHHFRMPDYYEATVRILVHKIQEAPVAPYQELAPPQGWDLSYYETQVEIIRSFPVCRKVVQKLNLATYYGVGSEQAAVNRLRASLRSSMIRNTRIITFTVTDRDPEWVMHIANAISDAYSEEAMKDRLFVSEQMLEWFPDAKAVQAETPYELLQKIEDESVAEKFPSVINNSTIKRLKEEKIDLEAKLSELLTRYTPEHPQIKELSGRLDFLKNEIKLQTKKITDGLKTALAGELNVSNIKVLEKAVLPTGPAGPNRKRGVLMWTFAAFFLGVSLAVFIDSLDKTIKFDEDILGVPGVPFLGSVPLVDLRKILRGKAPSQEIEEFLNNAELTDAINTLNTALLFSMPKGQNKLIMFTSTLPEEGKTTIAFLLASALAKLGEKILFVELDLRRPSLRKRIRLPWDRPNGISDYLVGKASFNDILNPIPFVPNLEVIFSGASSPNPVSLITSNAFDEFVKTAEKKYDRVIFDSPPALQIPDPIILSNKVHGVVYLIGAGMVHRKLALKTLHKFDFVGSAIFGAILNLINLKKVGYYRRYSYYAYGKKYGQSA